MKSILQLRWLLPIVELLLCGIVLWPLRSELISDLERRPGSYPIPASPASLPAPTEGTFTIEIRRATPEEQRQYEAKENAKRRRTARLLFPKYLNFPVWFFDLPFMGLIYPESPDRHVHDKRQSLQAVTWPLAGVLFWWMAGRGIEALFMRKRLLVPRIGPPEITAAIAILISGIPVAIFGLSGQGQDLNSKFFRGGAALWSLMAVIIIAGGILQSRIRKRVAGVHTGGPLVTS